MIVSAGLPESNCRVLLALEGVMFPRLVLPVTQGRELDLARLADRGIALCCFSGDGEVDRQFRGTVAERYLELLALDAAVVGVCDLGLETLEELAGIESLPYPVVSDEQLVLARRLGLPTVGSRTGGSYRPLVLVLVDGLIRRVFDPGCGLAGVLDRVEECVQLHAEQRRSAAASGGLPAEHARELLARVRDDHLRLGKLAGRTEGHLQQFLEDSEDERAPEEAGGRFDSGRLEDRFAARLVRCWVLSLQERFDWAERPLAQWSLSERFCRQLAELAGPLVEELASVCAAIASEQISSHPRLSPEPVDGAQAASQEERGDGATLWHCNLATRWKGPWLQYWLFPAGKIEFDRVIKLG